jgi:endonuclease/exonuclease/phosphatase family metal-dependent hydrolase
MALLRIMSINLLVDRADPDDLRRVIAAVDPDVLCVQELGDKTATVVADMFNHGHLDPQKDFFGLGIGARHRVEIERLDLAERGGWVARLVPDEWRELTEPLDVFNIHLINPINLPWKTSRNTRRSQIERVTSLVEERDAASVVIGDMNATPLWPEYKLLSKMGLDAARATGTDKRTWSHFLSGPRLLRIDHAFVAGVRPITTSIERVRATDHRGLIVDVEV